MKLRSGQTKVARIHQQQTWPWDVFSGNSGKRNTGERAYYDFADKSKRELLISKLPEKLSAVIEKNEELEKMALKLKR